MRGQTVFLASLTALISGCSTLIHGPLQDVHIDSNPPGATATITPTLSERGPLFLDKHKSYTVTTPAVVRLQRDNHYRIEYQKTGYKLGAAKVASSYDWLWAPAVCGPCEAVGQLPIYDLKGRPWPLRFAEAAFYEYPVGFFRATGRTLRIFSPEALMGTSFKLAEDGSGFWSDWHGVGTPDVSATLEPTGG